MLLKKVAIGIPLKIMDSIGSKDGVEFDTAGYLSFARSSKHKKGAPQGASIIFFRIRYFFSAFAVGRTGFSLSRCMLM